MTAVTPARAADLVAAYDFWNDVIPPLSPAMAALVEASDVVTDPAQYERAERLGLAGNLGPMRFESVLFDCLRFRLAMYAENQHGAESAFLFPVTDAEENDVDVVAWIPESGRAATLLGEIGTVGLWHLAGPLLAPPMVHESLLDWSHAVGPALFILEPKLAAVELERTVLCAPDRAAALRLHARLAPLADRPPQIVVPKARKAA